MGRMTQRVLNTREQCRIIMTSLLVILLMTSRNQNQNNATRI